MLWNETSKIFELFCQVSTDTTRKNSFWKHLFLWLLPCLYNIVANPHGIVWLWYDFIKVSYLSKYFTLWQRSHEVGFTRIPTYIFYSTTFVVYIVNFAETPECGEPEKPIYGIVKVHGEVAHYNCIPGYIRRGNSTRTCTWSGWKPVPVPECIGNYLNLFSFPKLRILWIKCD